jgi:hypothetical protein
MSSEDTEDPALNALCHTLLAIIEKMKPWPEEDAHVNALLDALPVLIEKWRVEIQHMSALVTKKEVRRRRARATVWCAAQGEGPTDPSMEAREAMIGAFK